MAIQIKYFLSISGMLIAVTSFVLGYFILSRDRTNRLNQIYALYCLAQICWSVPYAFAFWPSAQTERTAYYWFRLLHIGAIFIPPTFFHFVTVLLDIKRKKTIAIGYILAILFSSLVFTKYFLSGMRPISIFKYWGIPGPLYHFYLIMAHFYMGYACYLLYREYRTSTSINRKNQMIYLFIGMTFGYIGGSINHLLFYKFPYPPVTNILVLLYVVMTAYVIIRHHFLNIEVIIKRAAVFAGLFASVYLVFAFFALLGQLFFEKFVTTNRWVAMIPSVVVVTFMLRPLESFLVRVTDKFLFQKKYDYKELLKTFTGEVLTVLDLSKLVNVTVENLSKIIRLESCAVLIHDKDKDNYSISASLNLKEPTQVFNKNTHLINYLLKTHHHLLKDKTIVSLPDAGTVKEDLKKLNAELVIPIVLHDDLMGALTLGRKKSGEDFTQDDLDILLPLSQTLAVAISNARYLAELIKSESQNEKMKAITTLAAGMAHEIKNPLTAIKTYAAFMPKYWQDKEFIDKFNRVVPESVNRIDRIVKDLLAFSRPTPPEFKEVKITDVASHTLDYVSNDLIKNSINYSFDFQDNGAVIQADQAQLTQVFLNLFLNAVDAMPQGGMLTISSRVNANVVQICIKDTGCGISGDNLKHIFDPFFTTKDTGTGLGLSIVREIVANHQGVIRAESEVGKGTTFILEFPVIA